MVPGAVSAATPDGWPAQSGTTISDIDGIAVTRGPGLLGALLVGVTWAKTLAWREGIPLIGVHHMEGHLFAPTLEDSARSRHCW